MYSAMVSLCLGLSLCQVPEQPPADARFLGCRDFRLPIRTPRRPEVRQLTLYSSTDLGKTWEQEQAITNNEDCFIFRARVDGQYWFQVTATDQQGRQDPENLYDFQKRPERVQKWIIHTLKPFPRITSAQRQGEDIIVNWEIQELYPDWSTFKLEYQIQPSPQWIAVQTTPAHSGQARIQPGNLSPVTVKLSLRNRAGHDAHVEFQVPGSGIPVQQAVAPPPGTGGTALAPPPGSGYSDPASLGTGLSRPGDLPLPPAQFSQNPAQRNLSFPPAVDNPMPPTPPQPVSPPANKWTPGTQRQDTAGLVPVAGPDVGGASWAPSAAVRKALPPVRYVNTKEVTLEYQLSKVGPSGVGSVDLWWTRNDGQSWERYADDPEAKGPGTHQRSLPLPVDDGVVGFLLVVRSRAGLGRREPRSGDVPEIRIEIDTTPPVPHLFAPIPDPQRANALILCWTATDNNLGPHPITLEWAERREGPWYKIGENLANSGRHSWLLPSQLPVQVYLRVKAIDLAGNVGVATTNEPQLVDLSEPEGKLTNVITPNQR